MNEQRKALQLDLSSDEESSSDESREEKNLSKGREESAEYNPAVQSDKLAINVKYATEYEKRKRRQEFINSRQDQDDGSDDVSDESSSESEDEDAELLTAKVDLQILKVRTFCVFYPLAKTCLMIFIVNDTSW